MSLWSTTIFNPLFIITWVQEWCQPFVTKGNTMLIVLNEIDLINLMKQYIAVTGQTKADAARTLGLRGRGEPYGNPNVVVTIKTNVTV